MPKYVVVLKGVADNSKEGKMAFLGKFAKDSKMTLEEARDLIKRRKREIYTFDDIADAEEAKSFLENIGGVVEIRVIDVEQSVTSGSAQEKEKKENGYSFGDIRRLLFRISLMALLIIHFYVGMTQLDRLDKTSQSSTERYDNFVSGRKAEIREWQEKGGTFKDSLRKSKSVPTFLAPDFEKRVILFIRGFTLFYLIAFVGVFRGKAWGSALAMLLAVVELIVSLSVNHVPIPESLIISKRIVILCLLCLAFMEYRSCDNLG